MKKYPRYFKRNEYAIFDKVPKRLWAALVKDFAISTVGEDTHEADPEAWLREVQHRIDIVELHELD